MANAGLDMSDDNVDRNDNPPTRTSTSTTTSSRKSIVIMKRMRAIVQVAYGEPSKVLKKVTMNVPKPGPNEVLVQVHAASINPIDWKVCQGLAQILVSKQLRYVQIYIPTTVLQIAVLLFALYCNCRCGVE